MEDSTTPTVQEPSQGARFENMWGNLPYTRWRYVGRTLAIKLSDDATAITTGDGKFIFEIPTELDGAKLMAARAFISTVSSSGVVTVQVRNITNSVDILSTALTIDQGENSSNTAATPPVIDTLKNSFKDGDQIAIDIDGAGTGALGLMVYLSLQ